jgi:electron transfer flavoprotein beta subunit
MSMGAADRHRRKKSLCRRKWLGIQSVVVLRSVPDIADELEVNESGTDIDREWVGLKVNEFDDHALEDAILLKESVGGSVTALAIDAEGVDRMLQSAIARGADRIVKITAGELAPCQPATVIALLVAEAVKQFGADLVLTGVQTPEDFAGQLASALGAVLGWPHLSAIAGIQVRDGGLVVRQEHNGGYATSVLVTMPAVLGIQTASKPPRYVSGSKLRQATSVKPDLLALNAPVSSPIASIQTLTKPETAEGAVMWDGEAEDVADRFVSLLRERGLLKVGRHG